jgi:hypothetical protein
MVRAKALTIPMAVATVFSSIAFAAEILVASPAERSASSPAKQDCGELVELAWSDAERFVWRKLCKGQPADFNKDTNFGQRLDPFNADSWQDTNRSITSAFMRTITEEQPFSDILKPRIIEIVGAFFPEIVNLSNVTNKGFIIRDSRFVQNLLFQNLDESFVRLERDFIGGQLALRLATVKEFYLVNTSVNSLIYISNLISDMMVIENRINAQFNADDLRSLFLICCGNAQSVVIYRSKIDNLGLFYSDNLQLLRFSDSVAGSLKLSKNWHDQSTLDLHNSNVGRIMSGSTDPYQSIDINNLDFRTWSIEGEVATQALIDKVSGPKTDFLQKISDEYRRQGNFTLADDLYYRKRDEETRNATGVNRILGLASRAIVGYGVQLQNGFILIAILIAIGYVVFKTGSRQITTSETTPRSWLLFSVDAVIPGINFDEGHRKITFSGWRQYYLYALRASGILLFFLLLKYVSQGMFGGS